ncbi:putative exoribonuclease [Chloropicon primus]|uniref:Putative exoribonuclease n=1 Tax=Chloropicon primus TaxID=1764295 RepID=A0A5B8MDV6_9CHLO|nr:putative exoribonuclease [Chloropicon primus]UPQ97786.1 putative exoribonuclease [Chloropicon primus]|eukprot:QDZ18577.1 putative exoribonuclease [Chloropicon primus]
MVDGGRGDGREDLELRSSRYELGVTGVGNGKVEGSVRLTSGRTEVAVEVKGPEASLASVVVKPTANRDRVSVNVKSVVSPVSGQSGEREQALEESIIKFVAGVLDPSCPPRTTITVVAQILSEDGSLLACLLNATALALMEAGIPLYGTPVSVAVAVAHSEPSPPRLCLDPDLAEERTSQLVGTYSYLFSSVDSSESAIEEMKANIVHVSTLGNSNAQTALHALTVAEKAARLVLRTRAC